MVPMLDGAPCGHAVWPGGPLRFAPFGTLAEAEGINRKVIESRREDSAAALRRLLNA